MSSLMRRVGALAASAAIFPSIAYATGTYKLHESWGPEKILKNFNFFDQPDPTNGFVTYVNQSYAQDTGLVKVTDSGSLYMGVDHETILTADGPGRESVRIESNEYYDQGLYVIDIAHMPGSICGTWPAFWTVGPDWPDDGEIDIIEGVNQHESNKIVLHTSGSCDVGGDHKMSGDMTSSECGDASGTIGCVVKGHQGSSGDPFNENGGGVYAMEWQKEYLKIWFFPRSSIPESLSSGKPDPSTFGTPMAHLQGSCDFQERFTHQKLILDTTFCGDWAGGIFGEGGCPLSDPSSPMKSCTNFVAENPAKFKEAYWELNSLKIYQLGAPEVEGAQSTTTETEVTSETAGSTATGTVTAIHETVAPTTSTSTVVHTESTSSQTSVPTTTTSVPTTTTSAPATTASLPTTTASLPTTTASAPTTTASAPTSMASDVDAANTPISKPKTKTKTKSTSFVTSTTRLCPTSGLHTANVVPSETPQAPPKVPSEAPSEAPQTPQAPEPPSEPASEPSSAPAETPAVPAPTTEVAAVPTSEAPPKPTVVTIEETETVTKPCTTQKPANSVTSVDAVGQPATESAAPPTPEVSSIPPDSVVYTAPAESTSSQTWEIVSSSSAFVSVPTVSPSSFEPTGSVPSGVDSTSSPTTPSSPVFTGLASRNPVNAVASAIVGALTLLVLA